MTVNKSTFGLSGLIQHRNDVNGIVTCVVNDKIYSECNMQKLGELFSLLSYKCNTSKLNKYLKV